MATVYRGFDNRLQVHRAIKVLSQEYAGRPKVRARFEAEARTMAVLDHANIVRVYDVGNDGAQVWIVMELVEGSSLLERLEAQGPFDTDSALAVTAEILEGLVAAHDQGIVHRDIKPHNIMLSHEDRVRITDFGIARSVHLTEDSFTKTGAVMGTWAFMAPEQRVNAKGVDHTADLYGTGATLFAMVTHRTPMDLFAADLDPVMLQDVSDPLRPLIRRSTRYQRQERYVDAREMLQAVRDCRKRLGRDEPPLRTPSRTHSPLPPITTSASGRAGETYLADPVAAPPVVPPAVAGTFIPELPPTVPSPPMSDALQPTSSQPHTPDHSDTDTLLPLDESMEPTDPSGPQLRVAKGPSRTGPLIAFFIILLMIMTGVVLRAVRKPSSESRPVDIANAQIEQAASPERPVEPEPPVAPEIEAAPVPAPTPPSTVPSTSPDPAPQATPTPPTPAPSTAVSLLHDPVTNGSVGDVLRFTTILRGIEPQNLRFYSVHIAFRTSGTPQYTQQSMQRESGSTTWRAYLRVDESMMAGMEYIIVAKPDPTRLPGREKVFHGQLQRPHRVRIRPR